MSVRFGRGSAETYRRNPARRGVSYLIQNTPSLSQAQRLKKLSREGKCTQEAMRSIMSEEKKEEQERITLSSDTLRKYFPRSYTPLQMQQTIIKLLEQWQKKQQRRNER